MARVFHWSSEGFSLYTYVIFDSHLSSHGLMYRTGSHLGNVMRGDVQSRNMTFTKD